MEEIIYVMYDDEGDIFCAFNDENKAKEEAKETGAKYSQITLYKK